MTCSEAPPPAEKLHTVRSSGLESPQWAHLPQRCAWQALGTKPLAAVARRRQRFTGGKGTRTSMTPPVAPERLADVVHPGRKPIRMLWILALIAVVVIGGLALWIWLGGEEEPTVTFDGTTATYSGPETLEAGTVTFIFDAADYESSRAVAFIIAEMTDESLTMEDLEAYSEINPARDKPPWAGTLQVWLVSDAIEKDVTLTAGTFSVWASTHLPPDEDRAHPAAILEVTGG